MKFFEELRRRNVIKATMAYIVVAWVLIQVMTNILPIFQAPQWVMKILMILIAIGLPIWIFFSWVYDVTPEGIKKTSESSTDESITATTNKRLNILILILLTIAIGLNFFDPGPPNTAVSGSIEKGIQENSIAVLPFLDMSPLKDQEHYSDGIAIEILNALCKFKKLNVVGRTSSFAFKNKDEDIKSIGRKLNVNNVLEGSVQKQQDLIRISVRLTDTENGYTLFSESYSDQIENIYDLQFRIAKDVAEKIQSKLELSPSELRPHAKIDPVAYETFLKGKLQFINGPLNMKPGEVTKAKKYFEKAVALDSSFVEANAYLSLTYFNLFDWAIPGLDNAEAHAALDSAKLLARRALRLDSLSSGARLAMGSYYFHEYDWIRAEQEKRKAVELNPGGSEEKFMLASFCSQFKQYEEAISLSNEAMKLNPLDESSILKYVRVLFLSGKYEEGLDICNQLLKNDKVKAGAYQFLFLCHLGLGHEKEAGIACGNFLKERGFEESSLLFFQNDFKTAVQKLLDDSELNQDSFLDRNMYKAQFNSFIGNKEETLKYLYKVYENKETNIMWLRAPWFDFLRDDPRFVKLYEMAGLKAYDQYLQNRKSLEISV